MSASLPSKKTIEYDVTMYAEENQLVSENALSSSAIADCAVVNSETFEAVERLARKCHAAYTLDVGLNKHTL